VVREEKENKQKKNIKGEKNGLARHILTEKKKKTILMFMSSSRKKKFYKNNLKYFLNKSRREFLFSLVF